MHARACKGPFLNGSPGPKYSLFLFQEFFNFAQLYKKGVVANRALHACMIWIINEAEKSAGGIYLFENDASVKAFHEGETAAAIMKHPALSDIEAKVFDILPEHTKITRGPVD